LPCDISTFSAHTGSIIRASLPLPLSFLTGISSARKYPDFKPWVITAIAEEEKKPDTQLWRKEPSAEYQLDERLRRIKFFRKHSKYDPPLNAIVDRLESCERRDRCRSGACPECGRLIQRWFVRESKRLIHDALDKDDRELLAITIIPNWPIIGRGNLHTLDIGNLVRRLKYALDKAAINVAIGAIDFSFNEDRDGNYEPFWSLHFYLITSVANERKLTGRCGLDLCCREDKRHRELASYCTQTLGTRAQEDCHGNL
jgi:hypothetical protein